jgi:predicted signal transduction protein with EAL and GGDEF domain
MQTVATFLRLESHADIYRYDKTTFCLVYESRFFSDAVLISEEGREDTIREFLHNLLSSFHANNGKNLQFYTGIVPEAEKEHLKLAHIALTEAKDPRREGIYVYQNGDEKHAEDVRYYTGMLISAIDPNDLTARLVPHYQHIYDPKNPYIKKFEALVRIEYTDKDNSLTIIDPDNFIHIATYKRLLSEITSSMLHQILGDMKKDPELRVSINLHEQDWNDDRIMILLRQIGY